MSGNNYVDFTNLAECIRKCRNRKLVYNPQMATYSCPLHGVVCTDELLDWMTKAEVQEK